MSIPNNYYVIYQEELGVKNGFTIFVRAYSRSNAKYKASLYPESIEFKNKFPNCFTRVVSAGNQKDFRAEGVVPDFLIGV